MRAPLTHVEPIHLAPGALVDLAARHPSRYPMLLDSAASGALSQMSLLAALPRGAVWLDAGGGVHTTGDVPPLATHGFLPALDAHWRHAREGAAPRPETLPFAGGWVVYLGYELALEIEPALRPFWPRSSFADARPVAVALRVPAALQVDADGKGFLITEPSVTAAERAQVLADIGALTSAAITPVHQEIEAREEAPEAYLTRILRAQEYIRAGDIYQANLSRPWRAELPPQYAAADLYRRLPNDSATGRSFKAQFGRRIESRPGQHSAPAQAQFRRADDPFDRRIAG